MGLGLRIGKAPVTAPLLSLTMALLSLGGAAVAQEPRTFGAATFVVPTGWSVDSRPEVQTFGYVRGQNRCLIAMTAPRPSPPALDATFATAWQELFANGRYRRADQPSSAERTSPAGFRHAVGEGDVEEASGARIRVRLHVFPLGATSQWIALIANGAAALAECGADWNGFFASLRFRSAPSEPVSAGFPAAPSGGGNPPPAASTVATGAPQVFENITFVPPKGWTVRRASGLVQLSPQGTRSVEQLEVLLLRGRVTSRTLGQELEATWSEVLSLLGAEPMVTVNGRPYDLDEPGRSLAGVDYLRGEGGMRRTDGIFIVSVYAMRAGDRVERVAVVAREIREQLSVSNAALNPDYARAIRELVFGMKFTNQPQRPLAAARLRPGGVVGVWAGLGMSFGRIKSEFAVFFDNGLAYFGPQFPLRGLYEIDPVAEQPAQRRYWGTYTWSGAAGVLTMPFGTIPLRGAGAALELTTNRTAHRYIKLAMPPNPLLDGTWCEGGERCLRLTSDGRFEDTGAARAVGHETYPFPVAPARGTGRYLLRDHTLVLSYDGGPELRLASPGVDDARDASPSTLRLGFVPDVLTRR